MRGNGQAFAITALILCLLVITISSMSVQSYMIRGIGLECLPVAENISKCFEKLFMGALIQSSIRSKPEIFRSFIHDFKFFLYKFFSYDDDLKLRCNGYAIFDWNSTSSYTEGYLDVYVDLGGTCFHRDFNYKFAVEVVSLNWNESLGEIVFEASINGRACRIYVDSLFVYLNGSWIKPAFFNTTYNDFLTVIYLSHPSCPRKLFFIFFDENGVKVQVKMELPN